VIESGMNRYVNSNPNPQTIPPTQFFGKASNPPFQPQGAVHNLIKLPIVSPHFSSSKKQLESKKQPEEVHIISDGEKDDEVKVKERPKTARGRFDLQQRAMPVQAPLEFQPMMDPKSKKYLFAESKPVEVKQTRINQMRSKCPGKFKFQHLWIGNQLVDNGTFTLHDGQIEIHIKKDEDLVIPRSDIKLMKYGQELGGTGFYLSIRVTDNEYKFLIRNSFHEFKRDVSEILGFMTQIYTMGDDEIAQFSNKIELQKANGNIQREIETRSRVTRESKPVVRTIHHVDLVGEDPVEEVAPRKSIRLSNIPPPPLTNNEYF
jgi:hypothetical protein